MTDEGPVARDWKTISIIALAVVVTVLLGAIIGYVASGGLSDEQTSEAAPVATTPPTSAPDVGGTTTATLPVATTQPPVSTDPPGQLTILATEDTYTDVSDSAEINGFDAVIELEDDPPDIKQGLVRFDVTGIPDGVTIEQILLRLYTASPSGASIAVHLVDGEWTETETAASNAPAVGAPVATIPPGGGQGEPVEGDLTGVVTGPGPFSIYLISANENTTEIISRENGANGPALIVRWTP